jgi:hypothetical protein
MFSLIFTFLLLQLSLLVGYFGDTNCFSRRKPTAYMDGNVMIAGFPPFIL